MENDQLQRQRVWKKFVLPLAVGVGMLYGGLFPSLASAIVVEGPQRVLMIDGSDSGSTVQTFNIDATAPIKGYDFGFVATNGSFTSVLSGSTSLSGTYTFQGGATVNFAVKNTSTGKIYSMADPADYADAIYLNPITPSSSVNPHVGSTYYNTLVLDWDLTHSGKHLNLTLPSGISTSSMPGSSLSSALAMINSGETDIGFTITQALDPKDGFAPVVPTPVPLPSSFVLTASGIVLLFVGMKMKGRQAQEAAF